MDKIQVLIVGPIDGYGGIASVIKSISEQGFSKRFLVRYLNTYDKPEIVGLRKIVESIISILVQTVKLMQNRKVQIIHIHAAAGLDFIKKSILCVIALSNSKKVIFHIHASRFYDFYINQSNPFLKFYIRFILKKVDCIVPLCRDWKNAINHFCWAENVKVLNNPVKLNVNDISIRNRDRVNILFMGEFDSRKGLIDLLETALMLKKNGNNFTLSLCGKGSLNAYIEKFVEDNSIRDNIVNHGWVSGEKKVDLLKDTDIFVLPSYKEGVPIAILEAFSFGIPVISTKISGIPELVIDNRNGFLITPGDRVSLYLKILQLIENPELRHQFGSNNFSDVKKYSVEIISLQWQSLYESLVS
jgi:glycosyltransferase involved in cell wall biosynthesis